MIQAVLAALRVKGLEPTERLLLALLADYANEEGLAWPSISRLAQDLERSERTVQLLLKRLEARGLVRRRERPGKTAQYQVVLGEGKTPEAHFTPEAGFTPKPASPPKPVSGRGEAHFTPPPKPVAPEPPIEPPIEPPTTTPPYIPPQGGPAPAAGGGGGGEKEKGKEGGEAAKAERVGAPLGRGGKGANLRPLGDGQRLGVSSSFPGPALGAVPDKAGGQGGSSLRLSREEALEEVNRYRRVPPPPQRPGEMVRALREAGLWERLSALRARASTTRAWEEWLALTLAPLWKRATPDAFLQAVKEGLDALAARPDAHSPFTYLTRVVERRLGVQEGTRQGEKPLQPSLPQPSREELEALFADGVPFLDGTLGILDGVVGEGQARKLVVRDPTTDAVSLIPVEEALKRKGVALKGA